MRSRYKDEEIIPIVLKTNACNVPFLKNWVKDSSFNEIQEIAIGAACMITENINLSIGVANGAICAVDKIGFSNDGTIHKLIVTIMNTNNKITI